MRLTVPEPKIALYVDGFDPHDKLGRKETGKTLSELIERIEDPMVIALDGTWGSGKSFFLKCWVGEHLKPAHGHKAQTIYFDAFAHDFMDDPLIALTGAIAERFERAKDTRAQKIWQTAKNVAPAFARGAFRIGLAVATTSLSEVAGAAVGATTKELDNVADDFWKKEDGRRAAMETFKQALVDLTAPDSTDGPANKLVIVIDELDRCRPDYALSLLEVIKHFFATDNVHFVLGVNLEELQNSVRARYGSRVNAARYLQKFITVTMSLPARNRHSRSRSVVADHFKNTIEALGLQKNGTTNSVEGLLERNVPLSVGLRDAEQIATNCVIAEPVYEGFVSIGYIQILAVLHILKTAEPQLYSKVVRGAATFPELTAFFILPEEIEEEARDSNKILWFVLAWCFGLKSSHAELSEKFIPWTGDFKIPSPRNFPRRVAEHHLMEITLNHP